MDGDAKIEFAPGIRERYKAQKQRYKEINPFMEKMEYQQVKGDYKAEPYYIVYPDPPIKLEIFRKRERIEELRGMEIFLYDFLNRLIRLKQGKPVIAVDIGGMAGLTWVRLAKHFEQAIKEGKIAFVVTNLAHTPSDNIDLTYITDNERQFLEQNQHLVQFRIAQPSNFRKIIVPFPTDMQLKLESNADLIYENTSVTTWSKTPDIDILRIGKLLSPYGSYFVCKPDTKTIYKIDRGDLEREERLEGINMAHRQLVSKYGLRQVTRVESGSIAGKDMTYIVFKGPRAPSITVNL